MDHRQRARFRPDIQGLRAVAVSAVVTYHAGVSLIPGGYAGVDIFFVISGFLITSHLLTMLQTHGRIRLGEFYARRIRRIIPASFTVLALTAVASVMFLPRIDVPGAITDSIATAVYVPNLLFAAQGTDYLAETAPSPFQHYWSLGIEEQFYLLWPLVLLAGFVLARRSPGQLLLLVLALVASSFMLGVVLTTQSQPWAFFSLPSRAWELGVGALAAFVLTFRYFKPSPRVGAIGSWVGLAGIAASLLLLDSSTPFPGYAALLPVLSTALVIMCGVNPSVRGADAILDRKPLQALGKWSYSIYLIHWPLLIIPQAAAGNGEPLPFPVTLSLGFLSVPLAVLMYRFVEEPLRKPRSGRTIRPLRTIAVTAVASLAFVGVAATANVFEARTPIASEREASRQAVDRAPKSTGFVPSNATPELRDALNSLPATNADGCHLEHDETTVRSGCIYGDDNAPVDMVLFGDSHAAQWFPGVEKFAQQNSYRLHTLTKSSCPSVDIDIQRDGVPYTACEKWRAAALKEIGDIEPELVVISNYGKVDPADDSIDRDQQWEAGLDSTLDALPAESRAIIVADTPRHSSSPVSCLSQNVEDTTECDVERTRGIDSDLAATERRVANAAGSPYVDLNDYLCTEEKCPAVIGDLVVYRDAHHLTEAFSKALAPRLSSELERVT